MADTATTRYSQYCVRILSSASLGLLLSLGSAGATEAETCPSDEPQPLDLQELLDTQLQRAYQLSLVDAAEAETAEISQELWDLSHFETREQAGKTQVLVATWTGDFYNDKVGQPLELSRWIWVTPVPKLRQFAATYANYSEASLILRLEQYLGLPPCSRLDEVFQCSTKTHVAELWIDPSDLFRPCPDPETDDTQCTTALTPSATAPPDYQAWFTATQQLSGYPWTRLGYTYDWGSLSTEVGASEFVVRAGAKIEVNSVAETIPYLRQ